MNDVEPTLAATLAERAEKIVPQAGRCAATMRRARRRRLVNATLAGAMSVAVVVVTAIGIRAAVSDGRVPPSGSERSGTTAATTGPFGFSSTTSSEYPYVAQGSFRGTKWGLRAAAVRLAPGADVRVTLQISGRARGLTTSAYVRDYDDPLFTRYEFGSYMFKTEVAIVFGAAVPQTDTVNVSLDDGGSISAHVFSGHDPKTTLDADYYLAFLPSEATGAVVARDREGHVIAREVIPPR